MGIFKSTQDFKAPGAVKEHTNEVRGGGRDPGVKRPGAGHSLSPARSKFFRAAMHAFFLFDCQNISKFSYIREYTQSNSVEKARSSMQEKNHLLYTKNIHDGKRRQV